MVDYFICVCSIKMPVFPGCQTYQLVGLPRALMRFLAARVVCQVLSVGESTGTAAAG